MGQDEKIKNRDSKGRFKKGHKGLLKSKLEKKEEDIFKLYNNGNSLTDIGIIYNMTPQGIRYFMKKNNIKLRPKGSQTKKSKKKIGESNKISLLGKKHSLETKEKLSKVMKGREIKWKDKISIANKGRIISKEWREKISISSKGKIISEETREKMRKNMKKRMSDPKELKKILGRREKSSLEIKFEEIINELNLPFRFVGNGEVIIARKCPDFVHLNKHIAIEVYYRRHKEMFRNGLEEWKINREKIFTKEGWKLIFFDETQVNKENVIERLI